jgi:hypothetical protein
MVAVAGNPGVGVRWGVGEKPGGNIVGYGVGEIVTGPRAVGLGVWDAVAMSAEGVSVYVPVVIQMFSEGTGDALIVPVVTGTGAQPRRILRSVIERRDRTSWEECIIPLGDSIDKWGNSR